jgi:dethiobiotin synthetase
MKALVVSGTGTGVGKTIVTSALAAQAHAGGRRVAVVKVAQTGVAPGDEADVDVVRRLSQVDDVHELVRYPEPLAPATAARRAAVTPLTLAQMVERIVGLADRDLVLVEGAGGLLVKLDAAGSTIADLAARLGAPVLVVTSAELGTLSATALTAEAIGRRGLRCAGVVVGSWPDEPDLAARSNLEELPDYAQTPLLGALPQDSGRLDATAFLEVAARLRFPALTAERT